MIQMQFTIPLIAKNHW